MVYAIAGAILVVVIVLVIVLLRKRSAAPKANAETFRNLMGATSAAATPDTPRVAELRQNLRVKLLYQEDKIDAAIQVERDRNPNASLEDLMLAAIKRWERDNH